MEKLVFATNNADKIKEVTQLLHNNYKLLTLRDINCFDTIPETGNTIEDNAIQKATYIYQHFHHNCFADDTGLQIEALNNEPGVYSSRYAGTNATYNDNVNKVLTNMKTITNRNAQFITIICLIINGKKYLFKGSIKGIITEKPKGSNGFGYDPIFQPNGYNLTFAEMTIEQKNKISHRGIAIKNLTKFLLQLNNK